MILLFSIITFSSLISMNVVISIPSFSNSVNPLLSNYKVIGITDFPMIEVEKFATTKRQHPKESG